MNLDAQKRGGSNDSVHLFTWQRFKDEYIGHPLASDGTKKIPLSECGQVTLDLNRQIHRITRQHAINDEFLDANGSVIGKICGNCQHSLGGGP